MAQLQPIGEPVITPIHRKFNSAQTAPLSEKGRKALLQAFKEEIRAALNAKGFDVKELYRIATLAHQAHSILGDPLTKMDNMLGQQAALSGDPLTMYESGVGASMSGESFLPSSSDENFGHKAIQELVSGLQNHGKKERISDLIEAARVAKELGDVALRDKLLQRVHTKLEPHPTPAATPKKKATKQS